MYNKKLVDNLTTGQSKLLSSRRRESFDFFQDLAQGDYERINLINYQFPEYSPYNKEYLKEKKGQAELLIKKMTDNLNNEEEILNYLDQFKDKKVEKGNQGLDPKYLAMAEAFYNTGLFIKVPKNVELKLPVEIFYQLDQENPVLIDNNLIVAEENSRLTVVIDYRMQDQNVEAFHNGLTRVIVKDNAVLNIVKVQRFNDQSDNFDSNISLVSNQGELNWIPIELGGKNSVTNNENTLMDDGSRASISSVYFADGDRKMDLGFKMNHQGRHSSSEIESKGVLKDRAQKVFRGDLYFQKGASQANGSEKEEVLLLDKTVDSDSIPALFSEEDNVEGEHAVSAGQIDEQRLFYLMSRGMTKAEAKQLMVEAAFNPIFDKIPLNDLKGSVINDVKTRIRS
ncbi:iron-regulated ABC transporter permease protein SufD [Halanaerobium saccharolyticum]|uniref:Iron-regulated ABC transporter permease protein SufD n=1 Tax=Halanaerobium saccharolyticum TaxID=43595 RepID=A0A4R7YY77_9FIRM|nr:Fe-S cluster assembly protein SufD [Halanaerobium saccharolyticum]RAK06658.1 iron-regulated ABC transporter permease protein SufD [Halanaerobium saccharolyticum]TDW01197.1 iron-regulated ABC transporter permease protein SufD [Halanaerobium saccharolyticum]TDX51447.1 iron-regulated ABC transporter permease protein SufD [Halanaerobium saccharolyticum]